MRYILNSSGYIYDVSFGADIYCDLGDCVEYTGEIPADYSTLEEWHDEEIDRLNAWKVVDGNLVYDELKYEEIQIKCEQEKHENEYITRKELKEQLGNSSLTEEEIKFVLSNAQEIAKILPINTGSGKIVLFDNASENLVQSIELSTETALTGVIKLILNGKNIFKNTATTTNSAGISYTVNADRTITLNGTSNGDSELIIAGTSTSTVPIFVLKKDTDYYLEALPSGVKVNLYGYDEGLSQIYSGSGGEVIRIDNDEVITYATVNIEDGVNTTYDNTLLKLMLSVGNSSVNYEKYKEQTVLISLDNNTFESTDKITIDENGNVNLEKPSNNIQLETVTMPNTYSDFNTIYTVKDTNLKVDYKKSGFDYVTATGRGTLVLNNTADGYGSIRKLIIDGLAGESEYTLISSDRSDEEEYLIDLTQYTGTLKIVIEEGQVQVYKNDSLLGSLEDIYVKTYSPKTYIEVTGETCSFECEYMLENEFSIYCTRVEKNASIKAVEDMIKLEVSRATDVEGILQSSITLEANKIEQIVSSVGNSSGKVTPASIVQAINNDESSVLISADKVNLEGGIFPTIQNKTGTSVITTAYETEDNSFGIKYDTEVHEFYGDVRIHPEYNIVGFSVSDKEGNMVISVTDGMVTIGGAYGSKTKININGDIFFNDPFLETPFDPNNSNVNGKENIANKVTTIDSNSTDTQYPSAKCVYDLVGNVESILNTLNSGGGVL